MSQMRETRSWSRIQPLEAIGGRVDAAVRNSSALRESGGELPGHHGSAAPWCPEAPQLLPVNLSTRRTEIVDAAKRSLLA